MTSCEGERFFPAAVVRLVRHKWPGGLPPGIKPGIH